MNNPNLESKLPSQLQACEMLIDINKILDEKAHQQGLTFTTMDAEQRVRSALSTGIFSFDLMLGGGYAPGRMSYLYGPSGSCKSTTIYHSILSSISRDIITVINDHEASVDPAYLEKIGISLDSDVCGYRNKKGTWEITPKLRYALGTTAEATFRFMNLTMRSLPDKIQLWDEKEEAFRYFLISPEYEYKPTWKSINDGLKASEKLKDKEKAKVVEVGDFSPQLVFITDSLKSMLPDARDVDVDKDPIALLARCFSASFPLVKSLLGKKNCIYLCTNHITVNPMAMFANPESEPGGSAVAFYPDLKMKMNVNRAQGKVVSESHISGEGEDRYSMGKATIIKNKSGPCFRQMEFRIWIDEQGTPGRGIDPVFDIHNFLESCGLIENVSKNEFGIKLKNWETDKFTWASFKKFILQNPDAEKLKDEMKNLLLEGKAQEMYYANLITSKDKDKAKEKAKETVQEVEL